MRSLDLFSCIGNHAIGFARAGIRTVGFCEINEYRRSEIAKEFPGIPIFDDVKDFLGIPADIVIGGPVVLSLCAAQPSACQGQRPSLGEIEATRDHICFWDGKKWTAFDAHGVCHAIER